MENLKFLVDLETLKPDWWFKAYKQFAIKNYNINVEFIPAKPKSTKFSEYINKRHQIESELKGIIVCFGQTVRIFNPKFDAPSFCKCKIRIYEIQKNNLIPTDKYIEIITIPSIIYFITSDASFSFPQVLNFIRKFRFLEKISEIPIKIINDNDVIYYNYTNYNLEIREFLNQEFTDSEIEKILSEISENQYISLDTEFFPPDFKETKIIRFWENIVFLLTLSYFKNNKIIVYIFFYPKYKQQIQKLIKALIEKNVIFVGSRIKIDFAHLFYEFQDYYNQLPIDKLKMLDTRVFLITKDNSFIQETSLKTLASFFLYQYPYNIDPEEIWEIGKKSIIENNFNDEKLKQYAILDAVCSLLITNKLDPQIQDFFIKLSRITFDIYFRGIPIDIKKLKEFQKLADETLSKFKKEFKEKFNIDNIQSIKQVQNFLKQFKNIDFLPRTPKSNQISLRTDYLLNHFFEIREKITEEKLLKFIDLFYKYKLLFHFRRTFLVFDKYTDKQYRIHPEFSEFKTTTGRILSQNPCIQQLPNEKTAMKKLGDIIKFPEYQKISNFKSQILKPYPNHRLVIVDLKQADVRFAQLISQDKNLFKFFNNGDGYVNIFKKIFNKNDVSKSERYFIKELVLGSLYGLTPYGIIFRSGKILKEFSNENSELLIQNIFSQLKTLFKEYYDYLNFIRTCVIKFKKIQIFRPRNFNSIAGLNVLKIRDKNFKRYLRRIFNSAYNHTIQGLTNNILNLCVYSTLKEAQSKNIEVYLYNLVYDEAIFSVEKSKINEFIEILKTNFNITNPELNFILKTIEKNIMKKIDLNNTLNIEIEYEVI